MGVTLQEKLNEQPVIKPYVEMNTKPVEIEILECVNKHVKRTHHYPEHAECDPFSDSSLSFMERALGVSLEEPPFTPDVFNVSFKRDRFSLLLWKKGYSSRRYR